MVLNHIWWDCSYATTFDNAAHMSYNYNGIPTPTGTSTSFINASPLWLNWNKEIMIWYSSTAFTDVTTANIYTISLKVIWTPVEWSLTKWFTQDIEGGTSLWMVPYNWWAWYTYKWINNPNSYTIQNNDVICYSKGNGRNKSLWFWSISGFFSNCHIDNGDRLKFRTHSYNQYSYQPGRCIWRSWEDFFWKVYIR